MRLKGKARAITSAVGSRVRAQRLILIRSDPGPLLERESRHGRRPLAVHPRQTGGLPLETLAAQQASRSVPSSSRKAAPPGEIPCRHRPKASRSQLEQRQVLSQSGGAAYRHLLVCWHAPGLVRPLPQGSPATASAICGSRGRSSCRCRLPGSAWLTGPRTSQDPGHGSK